MAKRFLLVVLTLALFTQIATAQTIHDLNAPTNVYFEQPYGVYGLVVDINGFGINDANCNGLIRTSPTGELVYEYPTVQSNQAGVFIFEPIILQRPAFDPGLDYTTHIFCNGDEATINLHTDNKKPIAQGVLADMMWLTYPDNQTTLLFMGIVGVILFFLVGRLWANLTQT